MTTSLFIGVPLSPNYANEYCDLLTTLRHSIPEFVPTFSHTPHFSLFYLTKESYEQIEKLTNIVREYKKLLKEEEAHVQNFDYFNKSKPKTVFLQVDKKEAFSLFNNKMREKLKEFSAVDNNYPFHPHMTIGNLIDNIEEEKCKSILNAISKQCENINWRYALTEINIYRVDSSQTPQYQEIINSIKM